MTVYYTDGVVLQSFPVPEGAGWKKATAKDITRITGVQQKYWDCLREGEWRDSELAIARDNVTAIQFGDENSLAGTESEWKAYWIELRVWSESNPDFPSTEKRPTRPGNSH